MKKKSIKKMAQFLIFALFIGTLSVPKFASNDNFSFAFIMKGNRGVSYSIPKYRSTTNPSNTWKVNMTYSAEGKGSVATFWIKATNGSLASDRYNVAQGSGPRYYKSNSHGNKKNVSLSVQNNNSTTKAYKVSGYWDQQQ